MVPSATEELLELTELATLALEDETAELATEAVLDFELATLDLDVDATELAGAEEVPAVQQLNCAQAVSVWPPAATPIVKKNLTTAPAGMLVMV
jgi:hypothetical protein